jgi:hypothetical protein
MMPLVLVVALAAGQPGDVRVINLTVTPAAPAVNVFRWRLLPGLDERTTGDALLQVQQAEAALNRIGDLAAQRRWRDELRDAFPKPGRALDTRRVEAVLKPAAAALELYERAARCTPSSRRSEVARLRAGELVDGIVMPDFSAGVNLLELRARLHLTRNCPADAVRDLALALSLVRQMDTAPSEREHTQAVHMTVAILDVLGGCLACPDCPGLGDALALLPRPFLSPRAALEGLRLAPYAMLPELDKVLADPVSTTLDGRSVQKLVGYYETLCDFADRTVAPLPPRLHLAVAIQRADTVARAAMREAGYPEKVVAATPAVNAALLHALFASEEVMARLLEALALPYPQARQRFEAIQRQFPQGFQKLGEPALIYAHAFMFWAGELHWPVHAIEQRLDLLRIVEALREHAYQNGTWPARLSDLRVPVPVDPLTGQPFDYRVEGGVAILESRAVRPQTVVTGQEMLTTYRLTLRKPEERKP